MSAIYIHIPFCKQKCHYCNFFTSSSSKNRDELVKSIAKEIGQKRQYLSQEPIQSIYFGGGTPSMLTGKELYLIVNELYKNYKISSDCEISIESNPDDLNQEKLRLFKELVFNRLSIGIQSFSDYILPQLNRVHTAKDAIESIKRAQDIGFDNITIDLIYGIPGLTMDLWKEELMLFISLNINHLSAYFLTVEEKTTLAYLIKKNKYPQIDEKLGIDHFNYLCSFMRDHDFIHYEVSNFAKEGNYSRHNTNYWRSKPYLGIGPSAHSYNLYSRQWNVSNTSLYIQNIKDGKAYAEIEMLTKNDIFNELVMLGLRTIWGIDKNHLENMLGSDFRALLESKIVSSNYRNYIINETHFTKITDEGKKYADGIAADLFIV
jgi:oxygen-independent coproporphyrinogen-3 oxidase